MSDFDHINVIPAPKEPTYVCVDDEGHHFVYVGEDTFTRLPDGEEKDRWMRKVFEGKVVMQEIAGCVIFNIETGETTLNLSDDWEIDQ